MYYSLYSICITAYIVYYSLYVLLREGERDPEGGGERSGQRLTFDPSGQRLTFASSPQLRRVGRGSEGQHHGGKRCGGARGGVQLSLELCGLPAAPLRQHRYHHPQHPT